MAGRIDLREELKEAAQEAKGFKNEISELKSELRDFMKENDKTNIKIDIDAKSARRQMEDLKESVFGDLDEISKYYQKQGNLQSKLISKWNDVVSKNDSLSSAVNIDDEDSKEVYRLAQSFEAVGGSIESLHPQLKVFVDQMKALTTGKAFSVDNLRQVFSGLESLKNIEGVKISSFIEDDLDIGRINIFQDLGQQAEDFADTVTGVAGSARSSAEDIGRAYSDEASAVEEASRRERKAIEEIQKARQKADEERVRLWNDDDYNRSVSYYEDEIDLDAYDKEADKVNHLNKILDALIERRNSLKDTLDWDESQYKSSMASGDDDRAARRLDDFKQEIIEYTNLSDQIEYVQNRLIEVRKEMVNSQEVGDSWDTDNIKLLIESIRLLIQEVQNLSKAFGTLDKENGITSLLSQMKDIGANIDSAFNTESLENFKTKLEEIITAVNNIDFTKIERSLAQIQERTPQTNINIMPKDRGKEKMELYLKGQLEKYKKLYDELDKLGQKYDSWGKFGNNGITSILYKLSDVEASFSDESGDPNILYSSFTRDSVDDATKSVEARIEMIQDFMKKLKSVSEQQIKMAEEGAKVNTDAEKLRQLEISNLERAIADPEEYYDGTEGLEKWLEQKKEELRILKEGVNIWTEIQKLINESSLSTDMGDINKGARAALNRKSSKREQEEQNETQAAAARAAAAGATGQIDQTEIVEINKNLRELQDILRQGFDIKDEEGSLSFFERLSEKFKDISDSIDHLIEGFSTLVGLIGADPNKTDLVGIDPNNVKTVTQAFIQLRDVIKEINSIRKDLGLDVKKVADQTAQAVSNAKTSSGKPKTQVKKTETKTTQNKTTGQIKTQTTETTSGAVDVLDELRGYMSKAMAQAENMREQAANIVKYSIDGSLVEIQENGHKVAEATGEVAKDALEEAENVLGIKSPSREFMAIAKYCIDGYILGLKEGGNSLSDTIKNIFDLEKYLSTADETGISDIVRGMISSISNKFSVENTTELTNAIRKYVENATKGIDLQDSFGDIGKVVSEDVMNASNILKVAWQKENGKTASFNIDIEKMLTDSTITEIRKVLDLVDRAIDPDILVDQIDIYVAKRLSNISGQATPEINKLYKLNQELNKRYDTPLIEDTREKAPAPKVDKLAKYRLSDETIEDQNKLQTEMQETETQVDKVSTALERLAKMFKEAGEEEAGLTAALAQLKKTEILDLAKESDLYTPGSSKKSKELLAANLSKSYVNSLKAKDETSTQTKENIAIESAESNVIETNTNIIEENTQAIEKKTAALQKLAEVQKKANESGISLESQLGMDYTKKDIESLYKDTGFDRTGLSKANKTQLTHALAEQYANYENSLNKPGLNEIDSQLDALEKKSKELIETMSKIYAEPVSQNGNEDYYKSLYEDLERINQEILEMRKNLSSLDIPDTATALTGKRDNILRQTSVAEGMVAGRKGQITEIYESIDFEAQKAQQETEENILRRQQQMIARITSNEDYEKYGKNSWFAEYIEKAGQEMADIDQLYAEFEQRLAERKKAILAEEAEEVQIQENRGKFESYLRGISTTGSEEFGQNLVKYADLINSITADAASLDAAIQKVQMDMADESGVETLTKENQVTTTLLSTRQQLNAAGRADDQYTDDILDNISAREREAEMTREAIKAVSDLTKAKREESSADDVVVASNGAEVITGRSNELAVAATPYEHLKSFIETDLVQAIHTKNEAFNEESTIVSRVIEEELAQLERLRLFLYNDIPLAISEKNTAFQDELNVVRQVVDQEIAELGRLQTELTASVNPDEIAAKFNEVFSKVDFSFLPQKVIDSLSQINQTELQKNLQTILDTVKLSFGEDNFVLPDFTNMFNGLSQILNKGEALGNLVKVLESTQDRMQEIARTNIADSIDRDNITTYLSEVTGFMKTLDEKGGIISNLSVGGKSDISSQIDLMVATLKEYQAMLKDSTKNQDLFAQIGPKIEYLENVKKNLAEFGTVSGKIFTPETVNGFENLDQTIDEIKADIEILKQSMTDLKIDTDISAQAKAFEELAQSLTTIKDVILEKNKAFQQEAVVVSQSVEKEIGSLNNLKKSLEEIKDAVIYLNANIATMGSENTGRLFSSIQDILSKGDALKNFADVLKATEEEIKKAKETISENNMSSGADNIADNVQEAADNIKEMSQAAEEVRANEIFDTKDIQHYKDILSGVKSDFSNLGEILRVDIVHLDDMEESLRKITLHGTTGKQSFTYQEENPETGTQEGWTAGPIFSIDMDKRFTLQAQAKSKELDALEQQLKTVGALSEELENKIAQLKKDLESAAPTGTFNVYNESLKQFKSEANEAIKSANAIKKANKEQADSDIEVLKQVSAARTQYNNTVAENIRNSEKTNANDVARAEEGVTVAVNNASEAMERIIQLYREGKIEAEQYIDALKVTSSDEYLSGDEASIKNVRNAEYEANKKEIEQLAKLRDERNNLMAKGVSGENVTDRMRENYEALTEASQKAMDSMSKLIDMFNNGKIDDNQYKEIMKLFDSATKPSAASSSKVDNAVARQYQIAEKAVQRYQDAIKRVEELQDKHANGDNVSGRIATATHEMNKDLANAQEKLKNLQNLAQQFPELPGLQKAVDQITSQINQYATVTKEINGFSVNNKNAGFENAIKGYDTLTKRAETYYRIVLKQQQGLNLTANESSFLKKNQEYFENASRGANEFARSLGDVTSKMDVVTEKATKFGNVSAESMELAANNMVDNLNKSLTDLGNKNGSVAFTEEYEKLLNKFNQISEKIADTDWADKTIDDFKAIGKEVQNIWSKMEELGSEDKYQAVSQTQKERLGRRMAEWSNNNKAATEAVAQIEKLQQKLENIDDQGSLNDIAADFDRIAAEANKAGTTGQTFAQKLRTSFSNLGRYLLSFASFYEVVDVFKRGVAVVREMDTALTELRKVSDESYESLKRYQFETYDMADSVGTTATQIMQSTADWVRLGRSMQEAKEMATLSTKLLNVSEFENINDATQALVSATQAYKDIAPNEIVDKLNIVGLWPIGDCIGKRPIKRIIPK